MTGSKNRSSLSIAWARRCTCVSDRSRWYGVGSTFSSGSAARICQFPPSGSRYTASTVPPSSAIVSATFFTAGGASSAPTCLAARPRDSAAAFFFFFRFVSAMGSEDTAVGSLTGPRDRSTFRCARSPSRSPDAVPPYRRHRWLTLLPLVLAGCGGPFPQSALHPESDYARSLDALFHGIFWWAVLVFVLVESLLLFILLRYRQRAGAATPKATHGHTALEIAWTLAPALILVFIAVPTMRTIFATQQPPAFDALKIEVIGHQWWWEYRYPSAGIVTANELHVPVGRPVVLEISTADVIHSFWAPSLGGKRDLIPGHVNRITFTAESVGAFTGQCAEFCGASHANMRLRVMVVSDSAFQAWVRRQLAGAATVPRGSVAAQGEQAFRRYGCIGCHTMGTMSNALVGPNLTHLGSRTTIAGGLFPNDSAHLARWLSDPPREKPGSIMPNMHVPAADLATLIAFLRSMR